MTHRTLSGRPLRHIPALADIARDKHPFVVIQKSSQAGISELLINLALWAADSGYAERGNVLYLMPTQNQMDDFTQGRIDRALQDSAHLRARLQPEPPRRKGADRMRLKLVGDGAIYLRGAESRKQIASVDADIVILDEYDQMDEGVLELARKRLGSSAHPMLRIASTPRLPDAGINAMYLQSDQRLYFIPCPGCDLEQNLTWAKNVDLERAEVVCRSCREKMDVLRKGLWVPQAPGNDRVHGYHFSRLYLPWANIPDMIEASQATTPSALQEFHNNDLGDTFVPPGGGISGDTLDGCRWTYDLGQYAGQPTDMGIDVGIRLHVVIRQREDIDKPRRGREGEVMPHVPLLWFVGEVAEFADLDALMKRFNVERCVIDALPETHAASQFAKRFPDRVWLAYYDRHEPGHERRSHGTPNRYHINRTEALDEMYQRFREGVPALPRNARTLRGPVKEGRGAYYRHLLALTRTLEQDANGNWVSRWVCRGRDDHFAHAELYCMMASKISTSIVFAVIPF